MKHEMKIMENFNLKCNTPLHCCLSYRECSCRDLSTALGPRTVKDLRSTFLFCCRINVNCNQTNTKNLFLFFQRLLFSHSLFLDQHTIFGLWKASLSASFSFSAFFFLGNQHVISIRLDCKLGLYELFQSLICFDLEE